jgi:hypothetical protein
MPCVASAGRPYPTRWLAWGCDNAALWRGCQEKVGYHIRRGPGIWQSHPWDRATVTSNLGARPNFPLAPSLTPCALDIPADSALNAFVLGREVAAVLPHAWRDGARRTGCGE